MPKLRKKLWVFGGIIPALVIVFDQLTKAWAIGKFGVPQNICALNPYPGLKIEVSPVFDLSLVCNLGVSFGIFREHADIGRYALTVFALVMSLVLLVWLNKEKSKLISVSLGFIIGGALGNAIDRVLYGAVTDFLDFSDIGFKWVFNIADTAINIGVAGLLLSMFLQWRSEKAASASNMENTKS